LSLSSSEEDKGFFARGGSALGGNTRYFLKLPQVIKNCAFPLCGVCRIFFWWGLQLLLEVSLVPSAREVIFVRISFDTHGKKVARNKIPIPTLPTATPKNLKNACGFFNEYLFVLLSIISILCNEVC